MAYKLTGRGNFPPQAPSGAVKSMLQHENQAMHRSQTVNVASNADPRRFQRHTGDGVVFCAPD